MLMVFMFRFQNGGCILNPIAANDYCRINGLLESKTIHNIGFSALLSVDDTIHFLAQYRQELTRNNWKIKRSVFATIRESGLSMFYTSVFIFRFLRIYAF
jgi:hypothetical protein